MGFTAKCLVIVVGTAVSFALPIAAQAQDTEPDAPDKELTAAGPGAAHRDGKTMSHVKRRAIMPAGEVQLFLPVQISLSAGEIGTPTFVAPNLSFGLSECWTVRLQHSEAYHSPDSVAGICFTGKENGCALVYNNVTLEAVTSLVHETNFSLTANGGLSVVQTQPFSVGGVLGMGIGYALSEVVSLHLEPAVLMAFNERETNPHRFSVTSWAFLQASKPLLLFALVGVFSPFRDFSSEYSMPVGSGFLHSVGPNVDLGLQFTFTNLLGAEASMDDRQITVSATVRR